jgi:hypothetical protein
MSFTVDGGGMLSAESEPHSKPEPPFDARPLLNLVDSPHCYRLSGQWA